MKIVFLTNLVNHHQIPVADELYELIGDDYTYVAMEQLPDWLKKGGYSSGKTLLKAKHSDTIRIMWCARFLDLKHPELAIMLAEQLKRMSYNFVIDMFGSGVELERTKELAELLNVMDVVKFRGNMPNDEILKQLREHDIFIFTSDRNEGWGAVANEAMSNGCAFVGSDKIGSVPFLVKDGVNGLVFKSGDLKDLTCKVKLLIENQSLREKLSKNAYQTMQNEWSPQVAAKRFIELCGSLMLGNDVAFNDGPCSKM